MGRHAVYCRQYAKELREKAAEIRLRAKVEAESYEERAAAWEKRALDENTNVEDDHGEAS